MTRRVTRWVPLATAALVAACGGGGAGGTAPPGPPGPPTQLVKNAGDAQSWYFNNPLPVALSVKALDANGRAVSGVVVNWATASGGGRVGAAQSTTDATGVASTLDSLGSAHSQSVTATPAITTLPTITFTETAAAPPTAAAVSLKNLAFNPTGVVVQIGGSVTWTWNDSPTAHNVNFQATDPAPHPADSPTQATGTESFTFTTVGPYHFFCNIHSGMTGTLTVVH